MYAAPDLQASAVCSSLQEQLKVAGRLLGAPHPERPTGNHLLAALPDDAFERLRPHLQRVQLKCRHVLQVRNLPLSYAYFIESGATSMTSRTDGDACGVEVGILGRRDLVGVPIVLQTMRSPYRCVVQMPGEALRIEADALAAAMADSPALQQLLHGYVQAVLVQSVQLGVCNARHSVRERFARWLLVADEVIGGGGEIAMTHQSVARALGVRRAGVTTVIGDLNKQGIVTHGRGRIGILDHARLEETACVCHRAIRAEHLRVAAGPSSHRPAADSSAFGAAA